MPPTSSCALGLARPCQPGPAHSCPPGHSSTFRVLRLLTAAPSAQALGCLHHRGWGQHRVESTSPRTGQGPKDRKREGTGGELGPGVGGGVFSQPCAQGGWTYPVRQGAQSHPQGSHSESPAPALAAVLRARGNRPLTGAPAMSGSKPTWDLPPSSPCPPPAHLLHRAGSLILTIDVTMPMAVPDPGPPHA